MSQLQNDLLDCGFEKPAMISYCMPSLAHQQLRKLLCIFGSALMFFADRWNACDRGLLDIARHYHILPQFATVLPVSIFVEVDGLWHSCDPQRMTAPSFQLCVPSCLRAFVAHSDGGHLLLWLCRRETWESWGRDLNAWVGDIGRRKARIWHQPRAYWQVVDSSWSSWDFDRELPAHTLLQGSKKSTKSTWPTAAACAAPCSANLVNVATI